MLTADLVRARRRGTQLSISELDAKGKAAALELATSLLEAVRAHVGKSRAEVDEVTGAIVGAAKDRKLAAGLAKLLEDRCTFEEPTGLDPADLRRQVFSLSRLAWAELGASLSEAPGPLDSVSGSASASEAVSDREAVSDSEAVSSSDSASDSDSDLSSDSDADLSSDSDADLSSDSEAVLDSASALEADSVSASKAEAVSSSDSASDSKADSEAEAVSASASALEADSEAEAVSSSASDSETASDSSSASDAVSASASRSPRLPAFAARFDRLAVLSTVAASHNLPVAAIEAALYSDLRSAQLLTSVDPLTPAMLVDLYELAGPQAMLLRAVRVSVEVESASPAAYRTLFRKLKFLRLLYVVTPREDGGYLLDIDGPFSLFESATRYGLALALALPAIRELDRWKLIADVRWGTQRTPLTCKLEGRIPPRSSPAASPTSDAAPPSSATAEPALPDDLAALVAAFEELGSSWKVAPATTVLDLPGVGVCVPDLTFRHRKRKKLEVHLEVLGYWSRAAVWKRIELVESGLAHRIVFAVGQQLRVSEEALDDELPGALYVYKRTLSARAVLERIEAVASAAPI